MYECYNGKRVIITGGAGFVGQALAKKLYELGAEVNIIDIKPCTGFHCKDVRDYWQLESEVQKTFSQEPGYVFHLASLTEVADSFSRPYDYYETSLLGTLNVLELTRKYQPHIKGLVIASSDKAYGNRPIAGSCSTSDWLYPAYDPYSNSKRLMDELSRDYIRTFGVPARILRCANIYGPGQTNETTLITNTCKRLLQGKTVTVHKGSERMLREWLYIDDAVTAYLRAGEFPIAPALHPRLSVMNVGSGEVAKVCYVMAQIGRILEVTPVYDVIDDGIMRVDEQSLNCHQFHKIMEDGWKPTTLLEGLRKTVAWYKGYYTGVK